MIERRETRVETRKEIRDEERLGKGDRQRERPPIGVFRNILRAELRRRPLHASESMPGDQTPKGN